MSFLEFWNPECHTRLDAGTYSIEVHYVLGTDTGILLGDLVEGISGLNSIDGVSCSFRDALTCL